MQFAVDSNSSSLLQLLYTVKDCIKKKHEHKKVETSFFVGSVAEISMSCIMEKCNVQCNKSINMYSTLIMCYYYYYYYYYYYCIIFNNIGLQVSPT
jgi:hypothetical protein